MSDGLFLRHMGTGPQPALMLHCGLGVSGMWKGVADVLGDRLTMTAPDMLGHGRSPALADGNVHDQCCETTRPLLQKGAHLIGHSFGATIALRLALEAPQRIASLTLIEPVFFAAARGASTHASHLALEAPIFEIFETGDRVETARRFNAIWGGGIPFDRFPKTVRAQMADQMDFVVATKATLWDDEHNMLAPNGLERLTPPVHMVRGAQTVPIIEAVHQGLLARLPNASETVIGGAGHMLVATHPHDVARAISHVVDAPH